MLICWKSSFLVQQFENINLFRDGLLSTCSFQVLINNFILLLMWFEISSRVNSERPIRVEALVGLVH